MDLLCGRQLSVVTSKEVRQSPLVKLLIGINDANLVAALNHPGRLTVEASLGVAHELIFLFRHVVPPALQELLSLVCFFLPFLDEVGAATRVKLAVSNASICAWMRAVCSSP